MSPCLAIPWDKVLDAAGSAPGIVSRALMSLPKMVFTINTKNVVVEAVKDLGTWQVKDDANDQPL